MVVDAHGITIMPIQAIELTNAAELLVSVFDRYALERICMDISADDENKKPYINIRTYNYDGEICALSIFYDGKGGE